jgi:hypothetical protein
MDSNTLFKLYFIEVGRYALGVALSMISESLIESDVIDRDVVQKSYLPANRVNQLNNKSSVRKDNKELSKLKEMLR